MWFYIERVCRKHPSVKPSLSLSLSLTQIIRKLLEADGFCVLLQLPFGHEAKRL